MTAYSMAPSMSKRQSNDDSVPMRSQPATGFAQEQLKSHLSVKHSSFKADDSLFHTPQDLLCPITLSLFQDPVINAVGQVYERAAIQRHLLQAALTGNPPTDPISNAVLPSLDMVPVYPMRSRAAQYRESTARECVTLAAAPNCTDPVRYLRRAAELIATADGSSSNNSSGLSPSGSGGKATTAADVPAARSPSSSSSSGPGFRIPGMTLDFARYLAAHQSSAYNALVLKYFGNELLRAGCADAAADVFYRLLLEADERVQQAEYLQLCLDCWTSSSSNSSSTNSNESSAGAEVVSGSTGAGKAAAVDDQQREGGDQQTTGGLSPAIIEKLADFVQRQRCLSPSAIVHMLQSTNHGTAMAVQLCQVLLSRASATAAAAATAGSAAEAAVGLPGGLGGALEVLVSLVELHNSQLREQLQELQKQLTALEAVHRQPGVEDMETVDDGHPATRGTDAAVVAGTSSATAGGKTVQRRRFRRHGAAWKGGKSLDVVLGRVARVAAASSFAAASLLGGNHVLLRFARVAPLMYLLRVGL